jgi:hypothetical protein
MKKTAVILAVGLLILGTAAGIRAEFEREYPLYKYYGLTGQFQPEIERAVLEARRKLAVILKDTLSYKPDIYVAGSREEFARLTGSAFPDWGAAAARPFERQIIFKSPAHFNVGKPLAELVKHEYAHLALADRVNGQWVPRWVDEGVAMYTSAEWGWTDNLAMGRAVVFRSALALHEIEKLNGFAEGKAQTAYAESFLAVKYILDRYGTGPFNVMLDQFRRRATIDQALNEAIGATYIEFEEEFHNYLTGRYNLVSLFTDMYFLWIFLALVVIVGFVVKTVRRHRYYKKWDDDEKYQSTDFDYGDPDNPEQTDDEDEPWA